METIVNQLERIHQQRHDRAAHVYSEIILRFDQPRPEDADTLEAAMKELKLDMLHLQADVRVIEQYRAYIKGGTGGHGCKEDAQTIRRRYPQLFVAMDEQNGKASG